MVYETISKIYKVKGNRHLINLRKDFVEDSQFPFEKGEELLLKIDSKENRITIERKPNNYEYSKSKGGTK